MVKGSRAFALMAFPAAVSAAAAGVPANPALS